MCFRCRCCCCQYAYSMMRTALITSRSLIQKHGESERFSVSRTRFDFRHPPHFHSMRRAQKETVFGAELSSLSQDESTECPNIVLKLVTELFKPGRNQELQQLYSVKPSVVEVDALCNEIDSVVTSNLRLDKYSSAVVDEALKRIFHRAQHPVIPLAVADTIDRCGEGLNSAFANQQLTKMPKFNATVLEFLLKFLRTICVGGGSMRSTQVAAAWVPSLFQGPDSQPPTRLKFLKLLISNSITSSAPLSPAAVSPVTGITNISKSQSADSDEGDSAETDSGSAFSSPEAVRPVSHALLQAGKTLESSTPARATLALPLQSSTGCSDGVQDILTECRGVMQAFLISNRDLELKMSKIQSAQTATTPIASGIVDLRRELDEANQERVQLTRDIGILAQRIAVLECSRPTVPDSLPIRTLDKDEVQHMIQQALSDYVSKQALALNLSGMNEVVRDHSTRLNRVDEDVQSIRSSASGTPKQTQSFDQRFDALESRLVVVEHSDAELSRRLHSAVATLDAVEGIVSRNSSGADSSSISHLKRLEQRLDEEAESRVEIEARLCECESAARSGGDMGKMRKDLERMVAEVRSYTDDVLRVVKEEAKSRVQMDVENCFAPLARDLRAESGRGTVRLDARVGELEFLIRDLKTELHSELKSVAQAMAISDSNSNRTRARSPGKSEAQVLICEMKTEIDATLMEIRAIADESVRVTGRQQNDIARLDSSLVALSAAVSDADVRHNRDAAGASIGDVERVSRAVESMRLRLDSDARAIAALEQAVASNGDGSKDIKSQLLQVLRKMDAHDKKMSGFEGKVRWVEEHSSSTYSSPISSGVSSPAMLRTLEKQRALHSAESSKDSEQMRAQLREVENFVASLDSKLRDHALRVTKNDDSNVERIHAVVADMEEAINQARHEVLNRLEDRVSQLNGLIQDVVAASDEHSERLQQQVKESNQSFKQNCSTLGHRLEELESWRNTLRQSFDMQGSRSHDSGVYSSLDSFSASSNLASSRGASGDRLHLRSLIAKEQREDDQSRPISSRLASGRSMRTAASLSESMPTSRSAGSLASSRFAQRPEQAIDRELAEVKRLLGV